MLNSFASCLNSSFAYTLHLCIQFYRLSGKKHKKISDVVKEIPCHAPVSAASMSTNLYNFYIPTFANKILIYAAEIIEHIALPIGMMSEETVRKIRKKNYVTLGSYTLFTSSNPFITMLSKGSPFAYK